MHELVKDPPSQSNRLEIHNVLRHWRELADGYEPERLLLGETWVMDLDELATFYGRTDELQLAGIGFVEAGLRPFLPVLRVPRGHIAWEPHEEFEKGDLKAFRRTLWDFSRKPIAEGLRPYVAEALAALGEHYGARITLGRPPGPSPP